MAGREALEESLRLITGDDFEWNYTWQGSDFPDGYGLYYEFKTGSDWTSSTKWNFVISGAVASLRVESDTADAMPARTPYRLVLQDSSSDPTTEKVLVIGNVVRQEPRV